MLTNELFILVPIFFFIAIIYSSAGFGGGSSYLAILSLFSIDFLSIRLIALICNITVVSGSVYLFWKNGFLKLKRLIPLVLLSIPFAYLGASLQLEQKVFYLILGASLLAASVVMFFSNSTNINTLPKFANAGIGGFIGFISGIVGIGGGIFLSPVLHLTKWNTPKIIAASTAFFILTNSIAGLIGQMNSVSPQIEFKLITILILAVALGGQIGSRITINQLNPSTVKRVTAILIFIVSIRILGKHLGII